MSNPTQTSLLNNSSHYDNNQALSTWYNFKISSKTVLKNLNWFVVISALITIVSLSTMTSNFLINHINHSLSQNSELNHNDIGRNILMSSPINGEQSTDIIQNEYSQLQNKPPRNKAELQKEVQEEADIINALKADVKGQIGIEHKLLERIRIIETNHLVMLKEQRKHENNIIWIGIAICGILFIGSGFLFYAITTRHGFRFNRNDNISLQNEATNATRAPIATSNVTRTN